MFGIKILIENVLHRQSHSIPLSYFMQLCTGAHVARKMYDMSLHIHSIATRIAAKNYEIQHDSRVSYVFIVDALLTDR